MTCTTTNFLLSETFEQHTKDSREFFSQQKDFNQRQEAYASRNEARTLTKDEIDCMQTFSDTDYEGHKGSVEEPEQNTCMWFLEHQRYRAWLASDASDFLYISADPGWGKSVLSKSLIDVHSCDSPYANYALDSAVRVYEEVCEELGKTVETTNLPHSLLRYKLDLDLLVEHRLLERYMRELYGTSGSGA